MNEFINVALTEFMRIDTGMIGWYTHILPALQAFSLVITGVLLVFVVRAMMKANIVGGKRDKLIDQWNLADMSTVKTMRTWRMIGQALDSGNAADVKKAIIDSDTLLSEALRNAGIAGTTTDERLAHLDETRVVNKKELREAHRFAMRLQKELALTVSQQEARNMVGIYEQALQDLAGVKE